MAVARIVESLEREELFVGSRGVHPASITMITDDSRQVSAGALFVAVAGAQLDGHRFVEGAERAGASLVMVEDPGIGSGPAIIVRDSRRAVAVAAAAFYEAPAARLRFVGVTGTNGKTTTVGMLRQLLDEPEAPAASIGTLGVLVGGEGRGWPGGQGLTTPGPIELQRVLRELADAGVRTVAMEVSSHALDQRRVQGIRFDAAVFTNLTRDHLDYHGTMARYFEAKAALVGLLATDGVAVVNADDPAWGALPAAPRRLRWSLEAHEAEVRAEGVSFSPRGSRWTLVHHEERAEIDLRLIGDFNIANALGAAATALALGVSLPTVAARLRTLRDVTGRLEVLHERPVVIRDYAHTPDALERALRAVRPFTSGRVIVLFGCGGDRDRGKRPLMAAAARRFADHLIVTSDNPRTEDPERILDDIVAELPDGSYDRIEDRRAAIAHAIAIADPTRDVVLLAGKGHETYQIRGTTSHPFDERDIVRTLVASPDASPLS